MDVTVGYTDRKANNFGLLRLLFAGLVVVGHSPDMVGQPAREVLRGTFGTLTLGEVAVDAFFIISGYLITKSFLSPQPLSRFLVSRVLRIYPGYIVAFLISFYLVGWLGGGAISTGLGWNLLRQIGTMIMLKEPIVPGVFHDLPRPIVNGPMWSLAQEFRCYIMVAALGLAGLLGRRAVILALLAAALVLLSFPSFAIVRMASVFLCGMAYYVFRDRVVYHWAIAAAAFLAWLALLPVPALCEGATAVLGGYLIFWFAFHVKVSAFNRVGQRWDASYGLYLYAWPIANLIIQHRPDISPWMLNAYTIPLAAAAGYLSWMVIEHPVLALKDNPHFLAWLAKLNTRGGLQRPPMSEASPVPRTDRPGPVRR